MTRILLLVLLLLGLAAFAPAGAAQVTPTMRPGDNGMDTSFARIETDPRPTYLGKPTPVEATALIKNTSGTRSAFIVMFGLNGLSESVDVRLDEVVLGGVVLPVEKDERQGSGRQPKVWIKPDNLTFDEPILIRGTVEAHGNGQFHVGAIVIAFDRDYQKFVTPQQEYAEVYAFGLLSVTGLDPGPGRPPFQGQGNVPGPALVLVVAAVAALALLRRR